MAEIEIILEYPPSINKYYVKTRNGVFIGKEGKRYRAVVLDDVRAQVGQLNIEYRVSLEIYMFPPDRRKRDLDNICKALLDALTHADVWEDDSLIDQLFIYRGERVESGSIVIKINEAGPLIRKM